MFAKSVWVSAFVGLSWNSSPLISDNFVEGTSEEINNKKKINCVQLIISKSLPKVHARLGCFWGWCHPCCWIGKCERISPCVPAVTYVYVWLNSVILANSFYEFISKQYRGKLCTSEMCYSPAWLGSWWAPHVQGAFIGLAVYADWTCFSRFLKLAEGIRS